MSWGILIIDKMYGVENVVIKRTTENSVSGQVAFDGQEHGICDDYPKYLNTLSYNEQGMVCDMKFVILQTF